MLIGAVPYINAIPLLRGLKDDVRKAPPAVLDRLLRLGEIDIATAPVTTLFENPDWYALPKVAIGTEGSARSVLLCTRSPDIGFENVQSIYLDMESRTSAHLIKVLLALKYGRKLEELQFITPIPTAQAEAMMVIGDKALMEHVNPSWPGQVFDLGKEWTEWTQLPFVFACWTSRRPIIDSDLAIRLQQQPAQNLPQLNNWINEIEDFDRELLTEYFTANMNYRFEGREQQGLMTFHQQLRELNLTRQPFELRFIAQ